MKKALPLFIFFLLLLLSKEAHAGLIIQRPLYIGLTNGLVGYWTFDDNNMAGERAYDLSGQGNTGLLTNGPVRKAGRIGQALNFDGSNDYVDVANSSSIDFGANQDFTWMAWVKSTQGAVLGQWPGIIMKEGGVATRQGYNMYLHNSNVDTRWAIDIFVGGTIFGPVYGKSNIADNSWHFLVGVRQGSTLITYEDGIRANELAASSGSVSKAVPLIFGRSRSDDNFALYNGLIDEVRVYNRALTADEIKRLYKIGATMKIGMSQSAGSLKDGLVGYWTFDDNNMAGERAYDLSGQGNTGLLTNGPVRKAGRIGQALNFDGSNDYVRIVDSPVFTLNNGYTISAWIKPRAVSPRADIVNQWGAGGAGNAAWLLTLGAAAAGQIRLSNYDGTTVSEIDNDNLILSVDIWYHVVGIHGGGTTGTNAFIYVDGVLRKSGTFSVVPQNSNYDVLIGAEAVDGTDPFPGLIDDVRIYNRVLSPDEIKRLYKIGATMKIGMSQSAGSLKDGLVGYWSFDDNNMAGERAYDLSGQGNTGLLTNGPVRKSGRIGQALNFDGSNDYVSIGASPVTVEPISMCAWVKVSVAETTGLVLAVADDDGNNIYHGISISGGSGMRAQTGNGQVFFMDQTFSAISSVNNVLNRWQHVCAVFASDSSRTIFVDGAQTGSDANIRTVTGHDVLSIGRNDDSGNDGYFPGLIDEVRIYNRALSADEIKRLYNMGR